MSGEGPESIPTSADPRSKRPVKRRALTPVSAQAKDVDSLFSRPDQEIRVPPTGASRARSRLAAPPEIVTNVQGSSAGAGSGEFHVYKASRRREYERLRRMDEEVLREKQSEEFSKSKTERAARDEEKTRKNREKREKKMKARKNKGTLNAARDHRKGAADASASNGGGNNDSHEHTPQDSITQGTGGNEAAAPSADDTPGLLIHDDD